MFITFEGIDGSGKTTQIKLLSNYLMDKGFEVLLLREPGGNPANEKIRNILLDNKEQLPSVTELLLFSAARNNLVNAIIKPALNDGKIVICDRFYDSTTAYQGYGRGLSLNMIKMINEVAVEGLHPDITIYLKLELKEADQRSKNKVKDRIENSGAKFFNAVINGYEKIAEEEPERIMIINSSQELNKTHLEIISHIENKINKLLINKRALL